MTFTCGVRTTGASGVILCSFASVMYQIGSPVGSASVSQNVQLTLNGDLTADETFNFQAAFTSTSGSSTIFVDDWSLEQ
jgi:hypothetical protein